MNNFLETLEMYTETVSDSNDKKLLSEAIQIYDTTPLITEDEFNILNEIFLSLRADKTLSIIQDPTNLNFCISIVNQNNPSIKNKHDIVVILNELKRIHNYNNRAETLVINFLEACEHVEEDEIFLIQEIIRYLGNSWILNPFEEMKYNGELVKYSRLLPTYSKRLVKNKVND